MIDALATRLKPPINIGAGDGRPESKQYHTEREGGILVEQNVDYIQCIYEEHLFCLLLQMSLQKQWLYKQQRVGLHEYPNRGFKAVFGDYEE